MPVSDVVAYVLLAVMTLAVTVTFLRVTSPGRRSRRDAGDGVNRADKDRSEPPR